MTAEEIIKLLDSFPPFYKKWDFWISFVLGFASLVFSLLAYLEAKKAKKAANQAGTTVKIQTITIELTEIIQRLDKLENDITFSTARNLLSEITRRLRRLIAPFNDDQQMQGVCDELRKILDAAKQELGKSRPTDGQLPADAIYFAMQGYFADIAAVVAEIMGLLETRTIEKA